MLSRNKQQSSGAGRMVATGNASLCSTRIQILVQILVHATLRKKKSGGFSLPHSSSSCVLPAAHCDLVRWELTGVLMDTRRPGISVLVGASSVRI